MRPRLVPVPPTQGDAVVVDRFPFWIGASGTAHLKVFLPGIAERHASITEREDGLYLSPFAPGNRVLVDGETVAGAVRLRDAAVIELSPSARFEVVTGAPRARPEAPKDTVPVYAAGEEKRPWWRPRRRTHKRRAAGFPVWVWAITTVIVIAVVAVGRITFQLLRDAARDPLPPPALNAFEGRLYDSLMVEATTHIERGATLLDLGARDHAARELAAAIGEFDQSVLRGNPWVQQGVDALRKTVEELYRFNRLELPSGWQRAPRKTFDLSANLASNLGPDQFIATVEQVRSTFRDTFRDTVVVTGRDHPEHLNLYGPRSAMDIRVRGLRSEQVQFLIRGFMARGIRVKDFSNDQVLRAQIAAAVRAGVADRAGTGVHLHIDRYRDRNDRWTVRR